MKNEMKEFKMAGVYEIFEFEMEVNKQVDEISFMFLMNIMQIKITDRPQKDCYNN